MRIIIDLDNTLTHEDILVPYEEKIPNTKVINKLREYKNLGFGITIYSSRNMNTYKGNIGIINVETIPKIIQWLEKNNIPFDEVIIGKPWCGEEGFYVDDKAIRPKEFVDLTYEQIQFIVNSKQ